MEEVRVRGFMVSLEYFLKALVELSETRKELDLGI